MDEESESCISLFAKPNTPTSSRDFQEEKSNVVTNASSDVFQDLLALMDESVSNINNTDDKQNVENTLTKVLQNATSSQPNYQDFLAFIVESVPNGYNTNDKQGKALLQCLDNHTIQNLEITPTKVLQNATSSQTNYLPKEKQDNKTLPDFTEHDIAGLNFDLRFEPNNTVHNDPAWYYSPELRKVFVDKNIFHIDIQYLPKILENFYLRLSIVRRDMKSSPVLRCRTCVFEDETENEIEKESFLRCYNPNVTYIGTPNAKNYDERLALRIKLNNVQADEDGLCKESIELQFVCRNSCIRKNVKLAAICYLENDTEVLGKKVFDVKISVRSKRDKEEEEKKNRISKEKLPGKIQSGKVTKRVSNTVPMPKLSNEGPSKKAKLQQSGKCMKPTPNTVQVPLQTTRSSQSAKSKAKRLSPKCRLLKDGGVVLRLVIPNKRLARKVVDNTADAFATEMIEDIDNREKYETQRKRILKMKKKLET